jgi:hypothetical protein
MSQQHRHFSHDRFPSLAAGKRRGSSGALASRAESRDSIAMPPIALTDAQLAAVMRAAEPLAPADRGRFLEQVAAALQDREIGDGLVGRVVAEMQRKFWDPPQPERAKGQSKWAR